MAMWRGELVKDMAIGLVGGAAGLGLMTLWFKVATPRLMRLGGEETANGPADEGPLDELAATRRTHEEGESATAALGRLAYEAATGRRPSSQTRSVLSETVHWSYGISQGAAYGAARRASGLPDLVAGPVFGLGLWLLGDELAMPALGLQPGPAAASATTHLNRIGAHLAYGLGLGLAVGALRRAFADS